MEDNRIVDLYWARSEDAITETSEKYGKYCYAIAYNILSNAEDADESVNDTYLDAWQADELLRKDLRKFCAMFRQFGKDSLLLATLAYNVGPYRLLGSKTIPKSTLIKKLEAGDRNIYREYIAFCNYKGKRHAMLLKRRKAEFALLYIP